MDKSNSTDPYDSAELIRQHNANIDHLRNEINRLSQLVTPLTSSAGTPIPTERQFCSPGKVHSPPVLGFAIPNGNRCASAQIYEDMKRTNWHGRLGRVHMADVDNLPTTKIQQLDEYLYRTIKQILPKGENGGWYHKDLIFASLKDIGLRLEDRTGYVDAVVFDDSKHLHLSTLDRMRNKAAWKYGNDHNNSVRHWDGVVIETLVELARYRGLFTNDGMLRDSLSQ